MSKRHVFPILRYDEYLAEHSKDLTLLISVVKVLETRALPSLRLSASTS